MNNKDSQPSKESKQPSDKPSEKLQGENSPTNPPLSSPNEPTSNYPTNHAHTFSSDPSKYSYGDNPNPKDSPKVYTTEPLDTARVSSEDVNYQKERESQKAYQENVEDKAHENMSNRNSKKTDDFYQYAASHKEHTIAYVLLALGLLFLLFFNNLLGGLIIGMVAGYYFAPEIIYYLRNISQVAGGQDQLRYVVLTAILLGLFIAAPGIFLGAIIVATFKQVFTGPINRKP